MSTDNMGHMAHLPEIAAADVSVLEMKEATYQGSWKAAGGRSAWFMFRRNMDRLLNMCAARDFALDQHKLIPSGGASLSPEDFKKLQDALRAEDLFKLIEADPSGGDGTVLACLRDLRRYALLVEAEMVSRGVVQIERGKGDLKKNLLEGFKLSPGLAQNTQLLSTSLSQQMLVGAVKNGEPGLVSADLDRVETAMAAQGMLEISDEEIKSAIQYLRPGTHSISLAEMLLPKVRQVLNGGGDYYAALAIALGGSRSDVKTEMFARSYGGVQPSQQPAPEPETELTPIRQIMKDIRTELSYEDWELRSIERVAHYAFPELGDGVRQDLTKKARKTREGGGVYGRVAEVSGRTESEVQDLVLGRLYAAPDGDYNSDYDRDEHRRMTQAVSHALNCNSIDSALGCPDHILAELLVPHVIQYLRGETSGQLLEAGWTIGPHGQAIRPSGWKSLREVAEEGAIKPGALRLPSEPSTPGTPADGGHHGPSCGCGETIEDRPKVPRMEPRQEITDLYRKIRDAYCSARLTREFWYSLDIRNSTNEVVANLVVRDTGGCLEASLNQGFTGVTFDFSGKNLQHHLAHLADYLDK